MNQNTFACAMASYILAHRFILLFIYDITHNAQKIYFFSYKYINIYMI
jgi:hypothetical protein